jgi:cell division GTPase FtsZ
MSDETIMPFDFPAENPTIIKVIGVGGGGCQYAELLISNYDTSERAKAIKQLSLFD